MSQNLSQARINRRSKSSLKKYESLIQEYGTYIAGRRWQAFCTGTFRRRRSLETAKGSFMAFSRALEQELGSAVAFIAVPERTTSGVPNATPMHWHFVMCAPDRYKERLLRFVRLIWLDLNGNVDVREYDPAKAGAFYLAKTAHTLEFDFLFRHLKRVSNHCPSDLFLEQLDDPYIPDHVRERITAHTLALR